MVGQVIRLTVAFASPSHARAAIGFLAGSSLSLTLSARPVQGDADMALVDIDVPPAERDRLGTLLAGVHALVLEREEGIAAVA
jgi:hypothetical protein